MEIQRYFLQQSVRSQRSTAQEAALHVITSVEGALTLPNTYISVLSKISFSWHPLILTLILKYTSFINFKALLSLSILKGCPVYAVNFGMIRETSRKCQMQKEKCLRLSFFWHEIWHHNKLVSNQNPILSDMFLEIKRGSRIRIFLPQAVRSEGSTTHEAALHVVTSVEGTLTSG